MKSLITKIILILPFLPVFSSPAFADTSKNEANPFKLTDLIHYEKPEQKGADDKKWFLNLSGGYFRREGNTESFNYSYSGFIKYDDDHIVIKLNCSNYYGELAGFIYENRGTATINFDYFLFWRIEFFSYSMSDYDKITKLEHRNGTGAGLKFYLIRNNYLLTDLSGAPIYQYEKYEFKEADEDLKWSIRGRIELFPFDNDFSVRYYAYYIPSIKNRSNYRTIQDVSIYKKIASPLGIRAGYRRDFNTYDKESFEENPLLKKIDSTIYLQASLTF